MENKTFKVKITSIDHDTGTETVEDELELKNIFMLGENVGEEKNFASIIMNTSIMNIAAMLASAKNAVPIVKMANVMIGITEEKSSGLEDLMLKAILKG